MVVVRAQQSVVGTGRRGKTWGLGAGTRSEGGNGEHARVAVKGASDFGGAGRTGRCDRRVSGSDAAKRGMTGKQRPTTRDVFSGTVGPAGFCRQLTVRLAVWAVARRAMVLQLWQYYYRICRPLLLGG